MPTAWTRETDPEVAELRAKMDAFYNSTDQYRAFNAVSDQSGCWGVLLPRLKAMPNEQQPRVLEFGAGRSGFGRFFKSHDEKVHWTAQDVTDANAEFLKEEANAVVIGDLKQIDGAFDLIFSTYVWEHISDPRASLDHLLSLLAPGGSLFLFCPRYDVPGYVPPALRHHSLVRRHALTLQLMADRLRVCFGGRAGFWIVTDPALFHAEAWFRDSDAIHLVSRRDLLKSLPSGFHMRDLPPAGNSWRGWITGKVRLAVEIKRS